jgi:hypothetical protein
MVDTARLRALAEAARKPQGWKRIAFQASRLDEFREAASPDVVIRLLDEIDRLRHENHNLNWALGTDGYEQMYTEAERVEHAEGVALVTENLDRLAARKARWDALVPAGVDILDHIAALAAAERERDALVRERDAVLAANRDCLLHYDDARAERDAMAALLREARDGLAGGLWDYGPGQDEHDRCNELIEKLDAALSGKEPT